MTFLPRFFEALTQDPFPSAWEGTLMVLLGIGVTVLVAVGVLLFLWPVLSLFGGCHPDTEHKD